MLSLEMIMLYQSASILFTREVVGVEVKQCHAVLIVSGLREVDLNFEEGNSLFGAGGCVFDGWTGCVHKCHQCFELGVRTKENKTM